MWITLDSQQAIDEMLERFVGFHDACLREASLATETFVDERGAMSCPGHLDTSALLYLQSQGRILSAIELRCIGVMQFHLEPTAENCDSIISSGQVALGDDCCRLTVRFIDGPLTGPPNSGVWLPARPAREPELQVLARRIEWRTLSGSFGNGLRYRPGRG